MPSTSNRTRYPLGAGLTLAQLDADPHGVLARLREHEPVSWVPALDGWLVTRRDLCIEVMRDAAGFTVDDPRFSTARVVGPSMLSLDGDAHRRARRRPRRVAGPADRRWRDPADRRHLPKDADVAGQLGRLATGQKGSPLSFAGSGVRS